MLETILLQNNASGTSLLQILQWGEPASIAVGAALWKLITSAIRSETTNLKTNMQTKSDELRARLEEETAALATTFDAKTAALAAALGEQRRRMRKRIETLETRLTEVDDHLSNDNQQILTTLQEVGQILQGAAPPNRPGPSKSQ